MPECTREKAVAATTLRRGNELTQKGQQEYQELSPSEIPDGAAACMYDTCYYSEIKSEAKLVGALTLEPTGQTRTQYKEVPLYDSLSDSIGGEVGALVVDGVTKSPLGTLGNALLSVTKTTQATDVKTFWVKGNIQRTYRYVWPRENALTTTKTFTRSEIVYPYPVTK